MGCRHCFVADRLEDLVDEGWLSILFTSWRTRIFFGLFHKCMWQSRHPEVDVLSPRAGVTDVHQRVAPFWLDLHLRLRLCPCLYLNVQQTTWYSRSQVRNVCRFPEHSNGTFFLSQQVALFCELDLGLVRLFGSFLHVEQLLNPIPSSNCFSRKSSEAAEVTHILFRVWFLQFPSW